MFEKRSSYQCTFVTASMILTGASIAVGISFFSPYWLQNIGLQAFNESTKADYIVVNGQSGPNITVLYPHRGLWAQCGAECAWFWSSDYALQTRKFTPLQWHIACQVLYFIGSVIILVCEIYARVQMCCDQKTKVILSLGILLLISALLQLATFAVFGGGAYKDYGVISNPTTIISRYVDLGNYFWVKKVGEFAPYIGWSFWIGVVGMLMSIVSGVFFLITYCGLKLKCCCPCCCPCCSDD